MLIFPKNSVLLEMKKAQMIEARKHVQSLRSGISSLYCYMHISHYVEETKGVHWYIKSLFLGILLLELMKEINSNPVSTNSDRSQKIGQ